ncbi:MAG: HXXEE domain-containing protein, partial [Streptococcus parasanguinis]|nr:HXXEE domain-containing protein [Streptococcus parasanguinis]
SVISYLFVAMALAYTNLKVMHQIMPKIQISLESYMK